MWSQDGYSIFSHQVHVQIRKGRMVRGKKDVVVELVPLRIFLKPVQWFLHISHGSESCHVVTPPCKGIKEMQILDCFIRAQCTRVPSKKGGKMDIG